MTTLVNLFNATNKENIVVKPQIIEWGPYYQQLNARIAAHDIPTIAVMHTAQLGDYTRYVEPLEVVITFWALAQGLVTLHRAARFAGGVTEFRARYRRSMRRCLASFVVSPPPAARTLTSAGASRVFRKRTR